MSKIDDQIKLLFRKKARLELLNEVYEFSKNLKDPKDHKGLAKEVGEEVGAAILDLLRDEEASNTTSRISPKKKAEQHTAPQAPKKPIQPQVNLTEFVAKYGKLGFKKVTAVDSKGQNVTGIVKQVQYPHILVETEDGRLEAVDPQTANLKEG